MQKCAAVICGIHRATGRNLHNMVEEEDTPSYNVQDNTSKAEDVLARDGKKKLPEEHDKAITNASASAGKQDVMNETRQGKRRARKC